MLKFLFYYYIVYSIHFCNNVKFLASSATNQPPWSLQRYKFISFNLLGLFILKKDWVQKCKIKQELVYKLKSLFFAISTVASAKKERSIQWTRPEGIILTFCYLQKVFHVQLLFKLWSLTLASKLRTAASQQQHEIKLRVWTMHTAKSVICTFCRFLHKKSF